MLNRSTVLLLVFSALVLQTGCDSSNTMTSTMQPDTGEPPESDGQGQESGSDGMDTDTGAGMETGGTDPDPDGDGDGDGDNGDGDGDGDGSAGGDESSALYTLTFEASWSPSTHPINFPSGPHFSGLSGATHHGAVSFWQPGQLATEGVRLVAELGRRDLFLDSVRDSVTSGESHQLIEGAGIPNSPASVSVNFEATQLHPLVTIVSMVAPSPDWLVGVHGLDLRGSDGNFIDNLTVDAIVYDVGTDSGARYVSADQDTQPREPITRLTSNSGDTDFVDGLPVAGRFIFQKQ